MLGWVIFIVLMCKVFSAIIVVIISFTYLKFLVSKCEHFKKLEAGHLGKF